MSNTVGRQQPLGDRTLNHCVSNKSDTDHKSGSSSKLPAGSSSTFRHQPILQNSNIPNKSMNYTPNHYRSSGGRGNAPFKSPITLCFDRMLGAGKFVDTIFIDADIILAPTINLLTICLCITNNHSRSDSYPSPS